MTKKERNSDNDDHEYENHCSLYALTAFFNFIAFVIYGFFKRCSYLPPCVISSCGGEMNALPDMSVISTSKFTSYRHQYLGNIFISIIISIIIIL